MSAMPKISVIVPVYRTEKYLRECLDSILCQTLSEIEIIAINDGSPDGAIDILREYAARDTRIAVIDKENEGVGKARNDGLKAAGGEYVAFLDSDDYYPNPGVLETLYETAKQNSVRIAGGTYLRLCEDGTLAKRYTHADEYGLHFESAGAVEYADYQYDYGYSTYIYSRELICEKGISFPDYGRFQDPPFFVRAMAEAGRFFRIEEPVYVYREVSSPVKYSLNKTRDMLRGMEDDLAFSKERGLAKLHCLTAHRLYQDASYILAKNLWEKSFEELLPPYIHALSAVDTKWLEKEGYPMPEPFVPEVFRYLIDTTRKYEKLRRNIFFRAMSKIIGKQ